MTTAILAAYRREHGFPVLVTDGEGAVTTGRLVATRCPCGGRSGTRRMQVARQTLRWGETVVDLCCEEGYAMWGVPLMHNAEVTGALVVQGVDLEAGTGGGMPRRVRQAAEALLALAVANNLTNHAAILLARRRAEHERERFLAIEASKVHWVQDDLRTLYLREEPALLMAIKEGDLSGARAILNRILTGIYALSGERLDLLKSCIIELVVMMSRAAVEAGADPSLLLGANYQKLSDLGAIHNEEDLAVWVRSTLDTLIEGIRRNNAFPISFLLQKAFSHMRAHLDEPLRRDDVARIAGISPGHFSKLVTERMGRSFTDLLAQMRVDHAKELVLGSNLNFTAIALECGFCDQSHLNKHFRRATGLSPGEYRRTKAP
jgi:AraC-like DNA-binding protein